MFYKKDFFFLFSSRRKIEVRVNIELPKDSDMNYYIPFDQGMFKPSWDEVCCVCVNDNKHNITELPLRGRLDGLYNTTQNTNGLGGLETGIKH